MYSEVNDYDKRLETIQYQFEQLAEEMMAATQ